LNLVIRRTKRSISLAPTNYKSVQKVLDFEEEIHSLNSAKKYKNGELSQMQ